MSRLYCVSLNISLFVCVHKSTDCTPLINVGSILTSILDTRRSYVSNSLFTHDISESVIKMNNHKLYHENE